MRVERYGFYTLAATGAGDCQVRLAGQAAYQRSGGRVLSAPSLRLPMGLLPIEVDYRPSGSQPFAIQWSGRPHPQHMLYSLQAPATGTFEKRQLFDYPAQGMYGQYYVNREFKGDSVMEYVEPTVLSHWLDSPLGGNWCAVWRAKLKAPKAGPYRFSVSTFGSFSEVRVDGKLVHRAGGPPNPEMRPPHVEPSAQLAPGEHDLEVRFFTGGPSWYELRWTPPGEADQLLMPWNLRPIYPHF